MTPQDPILHAFERIVRRDPLAPLVVSPAQRATVEDVDALSRAAGAVLADCNGRAFAPFAPGTAVGLAAANGPGFLASVLALRRAGLAVLLLDARTPDAEALRILGSLGAPALLRCPAGWPAGPADWTLTTTALTTPGDGVPEIEGSGFVKLTSGSTGAPRGIATPSAALMADDARPSAVRCYRLARGLRDPDFTRNLAELGREYAAQAIERGADPTTLPAPDEWRRLSD